MTQNELITVDLPSGAQASIYLRQSGQGPALLCVHGWLTSGQVWSGLAKRLSNHYTILAPDLPGFGRSPALKTGRTSISGYAAILEQLAAKYLKNQEPFAIIAHSMGAIIALEMAKRKNISTHRFILSGCPVDGLPRLLKVFGRPGLMTRLLRFTEKISGQMPAGSIKLLSHFITKTVKPVSQGMIKDAMQTDPRTAEVLFRHLLRPRFRKYELAGLKIRAAILRGESDRIVSPSSASNLALTLDAGCYQIAKSGHTPMIENTSQYVKILSRFLDSENPAQPE